MQSVTTGVLQRTDSVRPIDSPRPVDSLRCTDSARQIDPREAMRLLFGSRFRSDVKIDCHVKRMGAIAHAVIFLSFDPNPFCYLARVEHVAPEEKVMIVFQCV